MRRISEIYRVKGSRVIAGIFIFAVVIFWAWTYSEKEIPIAEAVEEKEESMIKVAFSMAEGNNPWVTNLVADLTQAAKNTEMELVYHEPEETTVQWQKRDLMKLLKEDIDYLAIFPKDETVLPEVLEEAKKIGLPVIVISKDPTVREKCAAVISINYETEGRACAQILADAFGDQECNIVMITGPEESFVATERARGFQEEIQKYSNFHILASSKGEFDRLTAKYMMEEIISSHGNEKIHAVFASSDEEGLGALQALKITGYLAENDVKIVSINGIQDALKAIVAGEYTASIESSVRLGYVVFELAEKLERGFDKSNYVVIPHQIFDSSNAEKYLASLY